MTRLRPLYLANTEIIIESLEDLNDFISEQFDLFPTRISVWRETAIITSGAFVERVINRVNQIISMKC